MPIICAKCQLVRPEDAAVPVWQCLGCGVAYNKAADAPRVPLPLTGQRPHHYAHGVSGAGDFSWPKWLLVLALIAGCYAGYQMALKRGWTSESVGSIASRLGGSYNPEQLAALAAGTQAGDVFVFSADWCPNCREAKSWMNQHGFKYEQCDIDKDHGCQARLASLGGDGISYLIVRGHHMKDGFDSEEFAAALRSAQVISKKQQGAGQ
jgi:glutaredoxin